ncbi:hypothetical protein E3J49_03850 [Candidatus Bathyarchaeota archaeon]|nr:MAG: hypothetical protein E3J49_03850 [Candidatus Bathyarchaeota archaeon]
MAKGVTVTYFTSRDIAAIAMCAALWSVLSAYIAPIFWRSTHMPFFCDMLGMISLILALWWVRKFGVVTVTGVIATIITMGLNPNATHFLGFTAASVVFDILTRLIGYRNCLEKPMLSVISLIFASVASTAVAGIIIGNLFMNPNFIMTAFGGVAFFSVLHAIGGAIGGIIGLVLIKALSTRISLPKV